MKVFMTVFMNLTLHGGAMDSPTIRQLRNDWHALGSSGAARTACTRLATHEPVIAHLDVEDLAELVSALSCASGGLSRNEAAAAIAAMLKSATVDPLIPRAIIQALIPGVLGLARRIDGTAGPWNDLDAFYGDAVSCLFEQITTWSGTLRPYAAGDLLSGVRVKLWTLHVSELRHRSRRLDSSDSLDTVQGSIGPCGEELLATAIIEATENGLPASQGAVLYATAVLGLSLRELAELTGISRHRLARGRSRAVTVVVA
jgi:hypothetical protein